MKKEQVKKRGMFWDKRGTEGGWWDGGLWKVLLAIIAVVGVVIVGLYAVKWIGSIVSNFDWANSTPMHPLDAPNWVGTILSTLVSDIAAETWEGMILGIAVMAILVFAFADILGTFSTFDKMTSNIIAIGLAVIAGASRMVEGILVWLGLTAGLGSVAVGIIILSSFIVAIVVNFLMGRFVIDKIKDMRTQGEINEASRKISKRMGALGSWAKNAEEQVE